jgi:hypothetical protein
MKSLMILFLLALVYICFFGIIEGIDRMREAERQAAKPRQSTRKPHP